MKKILDLASQPVQKVTALYEKHGKYLPLISFIGGFLWDSFTLTRIDRLSDNLILLLYLILLGAFIILVNLIDKQIVKKTFLLKYSDWYPMVIQFFLGGLFSSYVVFYFKSASLSKDWLFLGILVFLLIANEFLEKRLTNLYLQMALLFLASLSFFIFFFPVILGIMSVFIFILSGLAGVTFMTIILFSLYRLFKAIRLIELQQIVGMIVGLFLLINLFYYLNWIPPVPLSMKSAGIYHHVHRQDDDYILKFEKPGWYQFWKDSDDPFHYTAGDTVHCFTSVFAPARLNKKIYHRWQQYDSRQEKWITTDNLGYAISGGREGGYRGYTRKIHTKPGKWRVEIITEDEQILGRINFKIKEVEHRIVTLKTIKK